MCEEKEKVVISPYVFAGIRPIDLPKSFYNSFKAPVVIYKINHVIDGHIVYCVYMTFLTTWIQKFKVVFVAADDAFILI